MNIIIPFNTDYLCKRYHMDDDFLTFLQLRVLPFLVNRLALDARIKYIEIFSNVELVHITENSDKVSVKLSGTACIQDANQVVRESIMKSEVKSEIIIQLNPLYPFIKINTIAQAFDIVKSGRVGSVIGSFISCKSESDPRILDYNNIGILTVFDKSEFFRFNSRVVRPSDILKLDAVEMVSLRSENDMDLFELVINSGFAI